MRIWAVANQKGGVGKTTTSVSLAGILAARGRSVLLVDLDPHGSLTSYFGHDPDTIKQSVYWLFQRKARSAEELIIPTGIAGLSLLPASSALATLDRQLGAEEGKGLTLRKALDALAGRYEYVLMDCPPVLGVLMVNALAACERLVIPVQTEYLALKGLERIVHTVGMISRALKRPVPHTIVPTMFDRRTRAGLESLRQLHETYPDNIWDGVIPVDTRFREASASHMPLPLISMGARGSRAYSDLLDTLLELPPEAVAV